MRGNNKRINISDENVIKKSNDLSIAKLQSGLTLQQMQLLAFAIFKTQKDGVTTFNKHEFEQQFNLQRYLTKDAYYDSGKLLDLKASTQDLENNRFTYWNVFTSMQYNSGKFIFKWTPDVLPHILNLQEKFIISDLTITANFKSGFSWILYDYLKALYGSWYKVLSKEAVMRLFSVEGVKSYVSNTSLFKKKVLDVAVNEVNKFTEFECWYTEKKVGRKITHFIIHFSRGKIEKGATEKQFALLRKMYESVMNDMLTFISFDNDDLVLESRRILQEIQRIDLTVKKGETTLEQADMHIKNMQVYINQLESIKEKGTNQSLYFNWLEEQSD